MTVVTNAEKTGVVKQNGYKNVQEFQDAETIKKATNERLQQIKDGKVQTAYSFRNVAGTMVKAGAIGCVIGMGIESIVSYRAWKAGGLSDEAYLKEILKAGGDAGLTAAATSGVMIPVSVAVTAAGASSLISIPIAFVASAAINKVIAPCFGRGDYRTILSKARYYESLENIYGDLIDAMDRAGEDYYTFVYQISRQNEVHQQIRNLDSAATKELKELYQKI